MSPGVILVHETKFTSFQALVHDVPLLEPVAPFRTNHVVADPIDGATLTIAVKRKRAILRRGFLSIGFLRVSEEVHLHSMLNE